MAASEQLAAFAKRMDEVCNDLNLPQGRGRQTALGKRFNVTAKAARKWLTGEGYPELVLAVAIANDAKVHLTWLLQGVGPKRPASAQGVADVLQEGIEALPKDDRKAVLDFLRYKFERADGWFAKEQLGRYLTSLDKLAKTG